jgi:hypothetical protein
VVLALPSEVALQGSLSQACMKQLVMLIAAATRKQQITLSLQKHLRFDPKQFAWRLP